MIKQFINRKTELQWLETIYTKPQKNLLVLYGRRRIGKTELLKQFIHNKRYIYFLATTKPEQENIRDLQQQIAAVLHDDVFTKIQFDGWEDLFAECIKRTDTPLVIVIDEFPCLIEQNKAVPSIFQKIWDEIIPDEHLLLILCGSSIGMMETQVLGYKSPLYGRRTGQWKLTPFTFQGLHEFFPQCSFEQRLQFYSFLDGIPAYVAKMDNTKTPLWNMQHHVMNKGEYLYEEAEHLLRQEFREPSTYFSILQAIAEGNTKYGEICTRTQLSKSRTSQYLSNLINLHVVTKEFPVTQRKESRNARYHLSDNYYEFWFKFIYPYRSLIEEDNQDLLLRTVSKQLHSHYAAIFEQVCRELLCRLFSDITRVGRWWYKDTEIDIVALSKEPRVITFGECKWSTQKMGANHLEDLKTKTKNVPWMSGRRNERFMLFSKAGFTEELKTIAQGTDNAELFDLAQLENLSNK